MNIQITSDRVTRATDLAWTKKFDENLKQGGVMRIEGLRFAISTKSLMIIFLAGQSISSSPGIE